MELFIEKMIDMLDYEGELRMDSLLEEIEEWDSLSFVSFLAMANVVYEKKLSLHDVREAKTVADLYDLIK